MYRATCSWVFVSITSELYFCDSLVYCPTAEPKSMIWFSRLKLTISSSTPPSSFSMISSRPLMKLVVFSTIIFLSSMAMSLYTITIVLSMSRARNALLSLSASFSMEASSSSCRIPTAARYLLVTFSKGRCSILIVSPNHSAV